MKQILLRVGLPLLAMVSLTGCIDDNYDLSNIDTTSEFQVKDLVLPINLDPVTLGDIIEIKDGDNIKVIELNGHTFYAIRESGSFSSDPINIPGFVATAPSLTPTQMTFELGNLSYRSQAQAPANAIAVDMKEPINQLVNFSATSIDKSIIELSDIYADNFNITLEFSVSSSVTELADIELANLALEIPKGLTVSGMIPADCNYNEGNLHVPVLQFENGKAILSLTATAINLPANNSGIDYDNHELNIDTKIDITSARLMVAVKDNEDLNTLKNINIDIDYTVSPINVNAVSGKIKYMLEGDALNISPISLSNLPDFLADDETNLILANPQIYLSVNNPVADEKLGYQSGLRLTAVRSNDKKDFELNNGYFRVGYEKGITGPYNFCLSPEDPVNVPSGYQNPEHVAFTSLSNVIAGNGLPENIEIKLTEPQIYEQSVTEFELNQNLPSLSGNWEFLAPLALKGNTDSRIVYTDVIDGWGSDDLNKLTIKVLEVSLNVTNETPLSAMLKGYPIDKNGNQISGVNIEGAEIPGGAQEAPVTIRISGEVKDLDGIKFTATVTPMSSEALSPDQSITLSKIRAKVSGNYITDF